jgi:RNA polymerase sigma-70 factor (ECF subfamily)
LAFRLLGDANEAEDVAQEAFLRILRAAPRYRPTAAFRTYLHRVTTRLCRDRFRKLSPSLGQDLDAQASAGPALEDLVDQEQTRGEVQKAIAALPVNQREAVVLRYYENLSYDEISQVTGASRKAVERLLARGRIALAKLLSQHLGR